MNRSTTSTERQRQASCLQIAIERGILDAATAASILVTAAQRDLPPLQAASKHLGQSSDVLARLSDLWDKESRACTSDGGRTASATGTGAADATQVAGKTRQGRRRRDGQSSGERISERTTQEKHWSEQETAGPETAVPTSSTPQDTQHSHAGNLDFESHQRYELNGELGRGGCGVVFRARDRQLERPVVLKKILDDYLDQDDVIQRFINEARITGQLEHPGIVPVHEFGIAADGSPFFAMKEIRGETLADCIARVHALPRGRQRAVQTRQLLDRFLAVCQTVAFAHRAEVIHRDIKPTNIMVGEFGETVLLDWGLARHLKNNENGNVADPDSINATLPVGRSGSRSGVSDSSASGIRTGKRHQDLTRQGTVLGTAAYMSPEQARGENAKVDCRSDVFSLGVMLYEILAGESPFRGDSLQDTITRVAHGNYRPLLKINRKTPRALAAICDAAMQLDRNDRYADAAALATDVQSYLTGGSPAVYREKVWERFDRAANNNRGLFRTLFLCTIVLAAGAILAAGRIGRAHRLEKMASVAVGQARDRAEEALLNERLARVRTQQQLTASRNAADQWLLNLSGDLEFYPGLESIRQSLIDEGIEHYRELQTLAYAEWQQQLRSRLSTSEHALSDSQNWPATAAPHSKTNPPAKLADDQALLAQLEAEWCSCTLRLADLLRLRGNIADSQAEYWRVLTIPTRLTNDPGDDGLESRDLDFPDSNLLVRIANARIGLALCSLSPADASSAPYVPGPSAADNTGPHNPNDSTAPVDDNVLGILDETIQELTAELAKRPENCDARNALIRASLVAARTMAESNSSASVDRLDLALQNATILVQQQPCDRFHNLHRLLLEERTRTLFRLQRFRGAIASCQQWIDEIGSALRESPHRPDLLETRSVALSLMGSCRLAAASPHEAELAYEESAQELADAWEQLYGEAFYRENRAILALNQSRVLLFQDDFARAESTLRTALREYRWLVEIDGATMPRIQQVTECYQMLVTALLHTQAPGANQTEEINRFLTDGALLIQHLNDADVNTQVLALNHQLLQAQLAWSHGDRDRLVTLLEPLLASRPARKQQDSGGGPAQAETDLVFARARLLAERAAIPQPLETVVPTVDRLEELSRDTRAHVNEKAYKQLLDLLCFGHSSANAAPDLALQTSVRWTEMSPNSAAAWHWLAISAYLNGDAATAEKAHRRAVVARGGAPLVEDDLVESLIAHAQGRPTSERLMTLALERASQATHVCEHFKDLHRMVEEN